VVYFLVKICLDGMHLFYKILHSEFFFVSTYVIGLFADNKLLVPINLVCLTLS
jgi:hypothetical protein